MKKKKNVRLPNNREYLDAEDHIPHNEEKKTANNSCFTQNAENLNTDNITPPSEEEVVTKILFPGLNEVVIMKVTFSDSFDESPEVTVETATLILEPEFYFFKSQSIIYGIILRDGIEEVTLLDIIVSTSGKIILKKTDHVKCTGEVSMEILYPKT